MSGHQAGLFDEVQASPYIAAAAARGEPVTSPYFQKGYGIARRGGSYWPFPSNEDTLAEAMGYCCGLRERAGEPA